MAERRATISRRAFAGGLGSLAAGLPSICPAQGLLGRPGWEPWKTIPSVVVLSAVDDFRLPAVHEAVGFWNAVFVNLGTPFRLGHVTHSAAAIPYEELRRLWKVGSFEAFARVSKISGEIFVALSSITENSFATKSPWGQKTLIVIGSDLKRLAPFPNGLQNMIAHELGHAIGLEHNGELGALMCGGRIQCYSARKSDGFLTLTKGDKLRLLAMYPPGWREREHLLR